jgi:hypothetical protein
VCAAMASACPEKNAPAITVGQNHFCCMDVSLLAC